MSDKEKLKTFIESESDKTYGSDYAPMLSTCYRLAVEDLGEIKSVKKFKEWLDLNASEMSERGRYIITESFRNARKSLLSNKTKRRQPQSANFNKLKKIFPALMKNIHVGLHGKSVLGGAMMDLSIEVLFQDEKGRYHISMSHYYEQNGDLVPDPDMQMILDLEKQELDAYAFQTQITYQSVLGTDMEIDVSKRNHSDMNSFLKQWMTNIINQGHKVQMKEIV